MPRFLRRYLLGCIAIAFAYLLWHATEPVRLDIGDPWSDAELVSSVTGGSASSNVVARSPLSAIVYGAIAKLGVTDIAVFRMFAIAFSALAAWALFHYLRRMWNDAIAVVGTALFATSLISLMHADSLQSLPLAHCACFIALWGLVRATETEQLRHYAAATIGSFACMFAASDDWLFLSAGALCTIAGKRGEPLARGNFRFVAACAVGGIAGLLASSHFVIDAADPQQTLDSRSGVPPAPLLTIALTPMVWIAVIAATWRALRSPSLRTALHDAMSWLVVVAIIFVFVASPRLGPPMLRVVSVLPVFAVGSAILIDRVLQTGMLGRTLGIAWIFVATIWGFGIMLRHDRAVLDRDDVAAVRKYLDANDGNDFVITNLLSDGVVQATFERHNWSAIAENDDATATRARERVLELFAAVGTDYAHAVVFTTPESRFVDRSLAQLPKYRGVRSPGAWPYLRRDRANDAVRSYDAEVHQLVDAIGAKQVLHFETFDVYRIDRESLLEQAGKTVPIARKLDFSSPATGRHKLLGWKGPMLTDGGKLGVSRIAGYAACSNPQLASGTGVVRSTCETATTNSGLMVRDQRLVDRGELLIRVERACDLRLAVEVEPESSPLWPLTDVTAPTLGVLINDFETSQCASSGRASFIIPKRSVRAGINLVTFTTRSLGALNPRADLRSLAIDPVCD